MAEILCCRPCKPRYRRLVDAIYPRNQLDGLINSNMQKLTFYAISQPEKLGRIAEYIVLRMSRDLSRQRYNQVKISVEAMDQLLQSCHNLSSLSQFIESFLKMLQKLLETNNLQMEKRATDSFVNFANIEENTPAYHREYDFFISKFAAMCHSNQGENAKTVRYAGLRGLRGVLWKSASDPLQTSIWERQHMEKIIPSILFNLQDDDDIDGNEIDTSTGIVFLDQPYAVDGIADSPKTLADQFLRELMAKAPFGLNSVLEPVLKHCDLHEKWNPPPIFAVQTFRAIMYSVKDPCFVIQALIHHLENMSNSNASVRIGIATVLSSIVSIAGSSIGPSLLGIFNSLLKQLRQSVEFQQTECCPSIEEEKIYQETLINTMGDYANALPDYQKVEIMMFTVGNIPKLSDDGQALNPGDAFLQNVLVKTILRVATKYKTSYLATVFTDSFLITMVQLALAADPNVRLDTHRIFQTLLDRHDNLSVLQHLPYVLDVSDLQLTVEKCSRPDQMFMRKHIHLIVNMLYKSVCLVPENDSQFEHMEAILCTMALFCVEVGYDEVLIELFRLSFALQAIALESSSGFSPHKRIAIHNLVAKYLNLSSQLMAIPSLCQHMQQVIQKRISLGYRSLCLLPELNVQNGENTEKIKEQIAVMLEEDASLLFDKNDVAEILKASGKDVQRLAIPFVAKNNALSLLPGNNINNYMVLKNTDKPDAFSGRGISVQDEADENSVDMSIDWSYESIRVSRKNTIFTIGHEKKNITKEPVTVETLRNLLNSPLDTVEEERKEAEKTQQILEMFRSEPFDKLMERNYQRREEIDLSKTVKRLLQKTNESNRLSEYGSGDKPKNIFELKFPSFVC